MEPAVDADRPETALLRSEPQPAPEIPPQPDGDFRLSDRQIRRNMFFCILLDSIWFMGWADFQLALQPLLTYLKASNGLIGITTGASMMGLLGWFLSPWITRHFRYKKWYMFVANVPCYAVLGLSGVAVLFARHLAISDQALLGIVVASVILNAVFSGFVALPHQEYVAACIPSTHRGRYTGLSMSLGALAALGSTAVGGWILYRMPKPTAFGFLFLLTFFVCQGGYVLSLFARERPTPVESSPKPWSGDMFRALWRDRPFLRFLVVWAIPQVTYWPVITFIYIYALKDLQTPAHMIALASSITLIVRAASSPVAGFMVDKIGARRVLYVGPLSHAAIMFMMVLWPHVWVVFLASWIREAAGIVVNSGMVVLQYGLPKPENRAGHFTMQIIANSLTGGIGVLVAGFLLDVFTFRIAFIASGIGALLWFPIMCWMISPFSDDARDYS